MKTKTFPCPRCKEDHPDTTIFCKNKQVSLVSYPTILLISLAVLTFAALLVTAFTQPDPFVPKDPKTTDLASKIFFYHPWLLYTFLLLLLLVWEGAFLRKHRLQLGLIWGVTLAAFIIIALYAVDLLPLNFDLVKEFFASAATYLVANFLVVGFWLFKTIQGRVQYDPSKPVPTLFGSLEIENASIARALYTAGDLLAGSIIFLVSAFTFPFLYLVIANYLHTTLPKTALVGLDFPRTIDDLQLGSFSLIAVDLTFCILLFVIGGFLVWIVSYNEGLAEIEVINSGNTGQFPALLPEPDDQAQTMQAQIPASDALRIRTVKLRFTRPSFKDTDIRPPIEVVITAVINGLRGAFRVLSVLFGRAILSIRNVLWPLAVFAGVSAVAWMSYQLFSYLYRGDNKFPWADWTNRGQLGSTFANWFLSWVQIIGFGLIALALITLAIALFTRVPSIVPDTLQFLRRFGVQTVLTYWLPFLVLFAIDVGFNIQPFFPTSVPINRWPLLFDFTAMISFLLFLILAVPIILAERRKKREASTPVHAASDHQS